MPPPTIDGPVICIDPGHGGRDPGAVGHGVQEKDVVLEVSIELGMLLEQAGCDVLLTRIDDVFLELDERADIANALGADAFISVHANAVESPRAEGIETFHFPGSRRGEALASSIQRCLVERFCPPNAGPDGSVHKSRGVKAAGFQVLRETAMPAALVELEFVSHREQARFLAAPKNQRALAYAIAEGVLGHLRVPAELPDIGAGATLPPAGGCS
jgi:N-acetylmuramoyl-L-alanine amidase